MNKESILLRNRDFFGKFFAVSSHSLYTAINLWTIEIFEGVGGGVNRSMKIQLAHKFEDIISVENLLLAWQEFVRGKRNKADVQMFASALIDNIIQLHQDLANKTYKHGGYYQFKISDPKPRDISKASVRDRLLHHAIYRILYPFFDKTFIADSFSCRTDKGTHKAVNRLRSMFYRVSKNNTRTCWVLKCDIKKFFASIDHEVLLKILKEYIPDKDIIWLLHEIIGSFQSNAEFNSASQKKILNQVQDCTKGLPLGNLTSQLLVNVYMNEFDHFVKREKKVRHYIRYADDFVILSESRKDLTVILSSITVFLKRELKLDLHPDKVYIKTFASGVDFLGWVHFPHHRVLRASTKRRMLKRIKENPKNETLHSYLGLLKHGNTHLLRAKLLKNAKVD